MADAGPHFHDTGLTNKPVFAGSASEAPIEPQIYDFCSCGQLVKNCHRLEGTVTVAKSTAPLANFLSQVMQIIWRFLAVHVNCCALVPVYLSRP